MTTPCCCLVEPAGPSCHTGRPSCFFRRVAPDGSLSDQPSEVTPFISELERTIRDRQASTAEKSYTKSLLAGGVSKINAKISEEAGELVAALADESDERVLSEAADLLFHVLVGLRARGLDFRQVVASLASRTKQSGHEEKQSRKKQRLAEVSLGDSTSGANAVVACRCRHSSWWAWERRGRLASAGLTL